MAARHYTVPCVHRRSAGPALSVFYLVCDAVRTDRDRFLIHVLELAFATVDLRVLCEDAAHAETAFGSAVAKALVARLADFRAVSHALEIPYISVRSAVGAEPAALVVTLVEGRSLLLAANHETVPYADGAIDWEHVSRFILLRIE